MTVAELMVALMRVEPDKQVLITLDGFDVDVHRVHEYETLVSIEGNGHIVVAPGFEDDDAGDESSGGAPH